MSDRPARLVSLDALRGLTIAGMILVNHAGAFPNMYRPLCHAPWHGFTPTDLVFPTFLFIVGVAMWFSFKPNEHRLTGPVALKIVKRTVLIFLIGLVLNAGFNLISGEPIRYLAVLQRIALCYGIASFLCLTLPIRRIIPTAIAILLLYWALLRMFGGPDPLSLADNAVRRLDLTVLGAKHLDQDYGIPFEPEGLLSSLPAIANVLAGFMAGRLVDQSAKRPTGREGAVLRLLLWGVPLLAVGSLWNHWLPINKPIWTSSYVVHTVALDLILLAFAIWIIDLKQRANLTRPLVIFGENPLFIYVLASIGEGLLFMIQLRGRDGARQPLMYWLNDHAFAPWLGPVNGGVAVALSVVLFYYGIAWLLHQRRIIIKI